jgi:hypothetical protein
LKRQKPEDFNARCANLRRQTEILSITHEALGREAGCGQPTTTLLLTKNRGSLTLLEALESALARISARVIFSFGATLAQSQNTSSGFNREFTVASAETYSRWLAHKAGD